MVENIIGVISPTVSDKLLETKDASGLCDAHMTENEHIENSPTVSDGFRTTGKMIISRLSFSHIVEIMIRLSVNRIRQINTRRKK